jgi:hypothetical protein
VCTIDEAQLIKNPASSSPLRLQVAPTRLLRPGHGEPLDLKYMAVVSIAFDRTPSCYINCLCCCLSLNGTLAINYTIYL